MRFVCSGTMNASSGNSSRVACWLSSSSAASVSASKAGSTTPSGGVSHGIRLSDPVAASGATKGGANRPFPFDSMLPSPRCVSAGGMGDPEREGPSPRFLCMLSDGSMTATVQKPLSASYDKVVRSSGPVSYGYAQAEVDIATGGRLEIAGACSVDDN